MFSFRWLCHGLLSELQILDDLFCCLYSSAPGLPPALIAYKKKIRVMGIFRRPIHEKESSYFVHSQKLKYYVMFSLFSTYVNYDVTILFFPVHVRWDYIKNVSRFLQKKNLRAKHFACLLWWHNELQASIITYYVPISNHMWTYWWLIHTFIAQNMIDRSGPFLIFILGFYVGECQDVLKKYWLWPNLLCWGLPEVLKIFFGSSMWLLLEEKTMIAPLLN